MTPIETVRENRLMTKRFKTLDEFWPYYVREHSKPLTRQLHFIGNTNLVIWMVVAASKRSLKYTLFGIFSSYVFAWVGHFLIERNRPATFKYPILSALGDMLMYQKMLMGTMDEEVARYIKEE